jgi:SnoaL-like domain
VLAGGRHRPAHPEKENTMTNPSASTSVTLARAFTEAWTSHDMEAAAGYLADDVRFDGPSGHSDGKEAYVNALGNFARIVTGVKILAAFGDDTQALIMYDVITGPFGTLTTADLLTFRDGKIAADVLTFDTFPMRSAQAAPPPSAPAQSTQ